MCLSHLILFSIIFLFISFSFVFRLLSSHLPSFAIVFLHLSTNTLSTSTISSILFDILMYFCFVAHRLIYISSSSTLTSIMDSSSISYLSSSPSSLIASSLLLSISLRYSVIVGVLSLSLLPIPIPSPIVEIFYLFHIRAINDVYFFSNFLFYFDLFFFSVILILINSLQYTTLSNSLISISIVK